MVRKYPLLNHSRFIIKEANDSDLAQWKALIDAAGFKCNNGTIESIKDNNGGSHEVPIWLINDPINHTASFHMEKLKEVERPTETKIITVSVMDAKSGDKQSFEIENIEDAEMLKQMYGAENDWEDISRIRMFYLGKEIMNDICIASYNINPEVFVWGLIIDED